MTQVTGVTWRGEGQDDNCRDRHGSVQRPRGGDRGGGAGAGDSGQGLVLPDEVLADLAGQLVARARAGEPVALTGHGGCCRG